MEDCVFCKIIEGTIPCSKVYEDDHTLAFLDIEPISPGHTLVIPKEHHTDIEDMPEETLCHVATAVKKLVPAVKKAVSAPAVNVSQNNGQEAGQIVFHSHTHIIPRFADDNFHHWESKATYNDGEAALLATKIEGLI